MRIIEQSISRISRWFRGALASVAVFYTACGAADPSVPLQDSHPLLGTFLFSAAGPGGADQAAFQTALREFNLYTLPVFFRLVEPQEGRFDFALPDAVADAAPADTVFYVPGLISNDLIPDWLQNAGYGGAQLQTVLVKFVSTVVEHFESKYPGRVIAYEPSLEPLSWKGPAGFWHKIGLDAGLDEHEYVRLAFRTARAAAPHGKLYVDDFGAEDAGAKSDALFALVTGLLADGTPIDGVGLEGHFMIELGGSFPPPPPADHVAASLARYAELGLETMITSTDIAIRDTDLSTATLAKQAQAFGELVRACRMAGCKAFSTWGLGDSDSWIVQYFPGWGSPLLFDAHYAPKPARDAVHTALAQLHPAQSQAAAQAHR